MAREAYSLRTLRRRVAAASAATDGDTLVPRDLVDLYHIQALYARGSRGEGQHVAFVEFAAASASDDAAFWRTESLYPAMNTPVRTVNVGGSASDPSALGETDLDLQYVGALAPAATLTAYLISDRGTIPMFLGQMYDAVYQAAEDGARTVSISLGTSDDLFGQATDIQSALTGRHWADAVAFARDFDLLVQSRGLSVFAAAGDSGAYGGLPFNQDRPQPIWPAIQPSVVAVGGTQLAVPGNVGGSESAWGGQTVSASLPGYDTGNTLPQASGGGGVSAHLAVPPYQASLGLHGRATPDIAAFSGPLRIIYQGRPLQIWGTSASAPIAAAISALVRQATGRAPDHATFYAQAADVRLGNDWNSALAARGLNTFYSAASGYDLCTGAGIPLADRLLAP